MLYAFVLAISLALSPDALDSPATAAPAASPAPSPSAAASPGTAPSAPAASASPRASATPRESLKEIGRVHAVSQFCQAFEKHFDASVGPLLADDFETGAIGYTLGLIEPHYKAMKADFLLHDDRMNLAAYVQKMYAIIPAAQSEINALRKSAALTSDPDQAKATKALAKAMQKALDRQKQIADDTQNIIYALMETHDNTRYSKELATRLTGGADPYLETPTLDLRDVRGYLKYQTLLDRIGDYEGESARLADTVAAKC